MSRSPCYRVPVIRREVKKEMGSRFEQFAVLASRARAHPASIPSAPPRAGDDVESVALSTAYPSNVHRGLVFPCSTKLLRTSTVLHALYLAPLSSVSSTLPPRALRLPLLCPPSLPYWFPSPPVVLSNVAVNARLTKYYQYATR